MDDQLAGIIAALSFLGGTALMRWKAQRWINQNWPTEQNIPTGLEGK